MKTKAYILQRSRFFSTKERDTILLNSEIKGIEDLNKGRSIWVNRWMLVHLAFFSGLRVFEIAALKVKDCQVDIDEPYLNVRHGKGDKPRDVYIDKDLADHLRQYIGNRAPDSPLFVGRAGNHYTTTALHISFKEAIKAANLRKDLTIHSARHTYATVLYSKSGNLRFIQKQLGHASLNMTQHYADVLPEANSRLANLIIS